MLVYVSEYCLKDNRLNICQKGLCDVKVFRIFDSFFFFNIYLLFWLLWILVEARGIEFPLQGLNLGFLHWKHQVLATGPPGKSLIL